MNLKQERVRYMTSISKLWAKLRSRKHRRAFAESQLKRTVPFQIRAMRRAFGWTQPQLAEKSGLAQSTISRAEDVAYGDLSFYTVLKIAEAFDVAFVGRFVPFSELTRWYVNLEKQSFKLPTFDEEDAAQPEGPSANQALRVLTSLPRKQYAREGETDGRKAPLRAASTNIWFEEALSGNF